MSLKIENIFDFSEIDLDNYLKQINPNDDYKNILYKRYMSVYYLVQSNQIERDEDTTDVNFWNYLLLSDNFISFKYFYMQNQNLKNLWQTSNYNQYTPRILLGWYNNTLYATVSDNTQVYRFVSGLKNKKNTDGIVYCAVSSKCQLVYVEKFGYIWNIEDTNEDVKLNKSALQVISCSTFDNDNNNTTWKNKDGNVIPYIYDNSFDKWVKKNLSQVLSNIQL